MAYEGEILFFYCPQKAFALGNASAVGVERGMV